MLSVFHYYYFDDFKVDVFGYDREKEQYLYSVETWYSSKMRQAKPHYTTRDCYINIITPTGKTKRLYLY